MKSHYPRSMISNSRMKGIKVVVKLTTGDDIICLDLIGESQTETIVCLGKKESVMVPLRDSLKHEIERRSKGRLDWTEIEKKISGVISDSKSHF